MLTSGVRSGLIISLSCLLTFAFCGIIKPYKVGKDLTTNKGKEKMGTISATFGADQSHVPISEYPSYAAPLSLVDSSGNPTGQTPGYTDPYAKYGGTAAYNSLVSGFDTQKQNIYGTATDAARTSGNDLRGSILDFVDTQRGTQRQIDNKAVNNELARRQGRTGILGMVGRGIQSGGVTLANKNASDSSAAGAIANAYGDIGRRNLSNVNNQYELGNRDIDVMQTNLNDQVGTFVNRKYGETKNKVVDNIVSQARNEFAALDAAMLQADLPTRIQIEQEKEAVRQRVLGELSQYDQLLRDQTASVRPTGIDERRAEATRLASLGTAPETAFNFTDEVPLGFQNTGPFAGQLPIFTFSRRRE